MRGLFRVTIKASVWAKQKHPRPAYVVADSRESAIKQITRHLEAEYQCARVVRLADDFGGGIFHTSTSRGHND